MFRVTTFLIATAAAVLVVSGVAFADVQRVHQSSANVRDYWTPQRMRAAQPVDRVPAAAKPGSGKPGGSSPSSSIASIEVTVAPGSALTAHGKVFFSDSGVNYVCSGTAIAGDIVWTAGHCVNEGPGVYYTNFMFVPAYRDGAAPYGKFTATSLSTTDSWRLGGAFGTDVGAATTSVNEFGQTLSGEVVERTLVFDSPRVQSYSVYGYPAAKRFNGQRMRVCNTAWSLDDTSSSPATMGIPCDMTGGSSGGGWVTADGRVASVVSYGYASLKNVLFGPHLEAEAQQLYTNVVAVPAA